MVEVLRRRNFETATRADLLSLLSSVSTLALTVSIINTRLTAVEATLEGWSPEPPPGSDPSVWLTGNGQLIENGKSTTSTSDHTDFPSVTQGGAVAQRVFTVTNVGEATLTTSSLTVPTGFSIAEGLSAAILPRQSDTFTVQLDTADTGFKSGSATFASNDPVRSLYSFAISGAVSVPPPPPPPPFALPAEGAIIQVAWDGSGHSTKIRPVLSALQTSGRTATTIIEVLPNPDDNVNGSKYEDDGGHIAVPVTIRPKTGTTGHWHIRSRFGPVNNKAPFTVDVPVVGSDVKFEWYRGSHNVVGSSAGANGAPIRIDPTNKANVTCDYCWFHDNEQGPLGGEYRKEAAFAVNVAKHDFTATNCAMEGSNGYTDFAHAIYMNFIRKTTVRNCYFYGGISGHYVKSRAKENEIVGNIFNERDDTEMSYTIDITSGGVAYVAYNIMKQGIRGGNSANPSIVAYSAEAVGVNAYFWNDPPARLTLESNYFLNYASWCYGVNDRAEYGATIGINNYLYRVDEFNQAWRTWPATQVGNVVITDVQIPAIDTRYPWDKPLPVIPDPTEEDLTYSITTPIDGLKATVTSVLDVTPALPVGATAIIAIPAGKTATTIYPGGTFTPAATGTVVAALLVTLSDGTKLFRTQNLTVAAAPPYVPIYAFTPATSPVRVGVTNTFTIIRNPAHPTLGGVPLAAGSYAYLYASFGTFPNVGATIPNVTFPTAGSISITAICVEPGRTNGYSEPITVDVSP